MLLRLPVPKYLGLNIYFLNMVLFSQRCLCCYSCLGMDWKQPWPVLDEDSMAFIPVFCREEFACPGFVFFFCLMRIWGFGSPELLHKCLWQGTTRDGRCYLQKCARVTPAKTAGKFSYWRVHSMVINARRRYQAGFIKMLIIYLCMYTDLNGFQMPFAQLVQDAISFLETANDFEPGKSILRSCCIGWSLLHFTE